MLRQTNYLILDLKNKLDVVGVVREDELLNRLKMNKEEFRYSVLMNPFYSYMDRYCFIEEHLEDYDEDWFNFTSTDKSDFYVTKQGDFYKIDRVEKEPRYIELKVPKNRKYSLVNIDGKRENAKKIVAKCFLPEYEEGDIVGLKDGNPMNLDVENLFIRKR